MVSIAISKNFFQTPLIRMYSQFRVYSNENYRNYTFDIFSYFQVSYAHASPGYRYPVIRCITADSFSTLEKAKNWYNFSRYTRRSFYHTPLQSYLR